MKNSENDTSSTFWVTDAIKSKEPEKLEQVRFMTRDAQGNKVSSIDTTTLNLILDFYQNDDAGVALKNLFHLNVNTILIAK